jgi:large subunit ribosomal protein L15
VNVSELDKVFENGATVDAAALLEKGLAKGTFDEIKILGNGTLTKKLSVEAHRFSKSAEEKITARGGAVKRLIGG